MPSFGMSSFKTQPHSSQICVLFPTAVTVAVIMSTFLYPTMGFNCEPCDRDTCEPAPQDCKYGQTTDSCDCCVVCAKGENEICGGQYVAYGKCSPGLECRITPVPGKRLSDSDPGTCRASTPPSLGSSNCDKAKECQVVFVPECPPDSYAKKMETLPGQCCPSKPTCQCLPCRTTDTMCQPGYLKVITKGFGLPGNCCDSYDCQPRDVVCRNVMCEADQAAAEVCPHDSYLLPPEIYNNGCCTRSRGCECKTRFDCEPIVCGKGQHPRLVRVSNGLSPGNCCDVYTCDNSSCIHNEIERKDGEVWAQDMCANFTCRAGVILQMQVECTRPVNCGWMTKPPGECCYQCKGCVSESTGEFYENGETWQDTDCVSCRCEGGQVYCQAEFCVTDCTHPRKVNGICCPVCDGNQTHIAVPPHCPPITGCDLSCEGGLSIDQYGCQVCECKPIENPDSLKDFDIYCPKGFNLMDDSTGMTVCEYAPAGDTCLSLQNCSKQCVYGFRQDKQGCPKCKCQKCPPLNCNKDCPGGLITNHKGCQLCKCAATESTVLLTLPPPASNRRCLSLEGHIMEDGQSWHDGCRRCFCYEGRELCTLMSCPVPKCRFPFIRNGDCCPSCRGDELLPPSLTTRCVTETGQGLVEGETWQLDQCTLCICHDGGMMCEIESCPPILCSNPLRPPGQCCLVCPPEYRPVELPLLGSDSGVEAGVCRSPSGVKYQQGDTWRVNACQSCVCRHGQIHCYSLTCPVLSCKQTVLRKGQCCPVCAEGSVQMVKHCVHQGIIYSEGELWQLDDCLKCFCTNGEPHCWEDRCDPIPVECPHVLRLPGRCCAECVDSTISPLPESQYTSPAVTSTVLTVREPRMSPALKTAVAIIVALIIIVILLVVFALWRRPWKRTGLYDVHAKEPKLESFNNLDPERKPFTDNSKEKGQNERNDRLLQQTPLPELPFSSTDASVNEYTVEPVKMRSAQPRPMSNGDVPGHNDHNQSLDNINSSTLSSRRSDYVYLDMPLSQVDEYTPLTSEDSQQHPMAATNQARQWRYSCAEQPSSHKPLLQDNTHICDITSNRKSL